MGKGEIARYEQFLLFPRCFQKACFPGASKGVIVWEWAKECTCRRQINDGFIFEMMEDIVEKGQSADYQHINFSFPYKVFKGLFSQVCLR